MNDNPNSVNLFWTSGWDSTFRLLQLLFIEKKKVQPYYIIDITRKSSTVEMDRMKQIRDMILQDHPSVDKYFLPAFKIKSEHIPIDRKIATVWRNIRNERHIGAQYKLLASFCKQMELDSIELSIQKHTADHRADHSLATILTGDHVSRDYRILFDYFTFPLIDLSKQEMKTIANRNDWMPYLKQTWFCHRPVHNPFAGPVACGACNPCTIAMEEGFGWRIPWISKLIGPVLKKISHKISFY